MTASEELKKQFGEAIKNNTVLDFYKSNGVDATEENIKAFFADKVVQDGELSPDELESAAGGGFSIGWTDAIASAVRYANLKGDDLPETVNGALDVVTKTLVATHVPNIDLENGRTALDTVASIITVGITCGAFVIVSAATGQTNYTGELKDDHESRSCNHHG